MAESKQFDQFVIEDTSPTVVYSPTRGTFGKPDYSAGWNPVVDGKGADGVATADFQLFVDNGTHHIISPKGTGVESLSIHFQGTYIQLLGDSAFVTYDILIDNQVVTNDGRNISTDILATLQNLPDGNHTVSIGNFISNALPGNPMARMDFDKAIIKYPVQSSEDRFNVTLDPSNNKSMTLTGGWSSDPRFHQSNTAGDKARASFMGVSLQIRGTVSPTGGNYSVTLDNSIYYYTSRSSFTDENTLLFHAGGLRNDTLHLLEIKNEGGGSLTLSVNGTTTVASSNQTFTNILDPQDDPASPALPPKASSPSRSSHLGAILGGAIGGLILIILVVIGWFIRKRRRWSKDQPITTPFDMRTYDTENIVPVQLASSVTRRNVRGQVSDTISTPVNFSKHPRLTTPTPSPPSSVGQGSLPRAHTRIPERAADLAHMRNELANLRETVQLILSSRQGDMESEASAPPAYRSSIGD
ncbi:hypothetical protein Moror_1685 [Moniliophthora roreri MCA 2997]|uniref:Transmembrane protein n=1 Tax=Moniliophthora roreri (strain MCA 2997) TaxID=1381753 RepID=V2X2Y1_MONRO|nr:hypothetical protein Moror_1685 [Moniliophthora roreri MCA 2997]